MKNNNDDDKQHSLFPVVSVSFGHKCVPFLYQTHLTSERLKSSDVKWVCLIYRFHTRRQTTFTSLA